MSQEVFDDLSQSLKEAGSILRGETEDYRKYARKIEPPENRSNTLAVCVKTDDKELLIIGKIYDVKVVSGKRVAVKDEAGETVICPTEDFLLIEFQPNIEKQLRDLVAV